MIALNGTIKDVLVKGFHDDPLNHFGTFLGLNADKDAIHFQIFKTYTLYYSHFSPLHDSCCSVLQRNLFNELILHYKLKVFREFFFFFSFLQLVSSSCYIHKLLFLFLFFYG